MQRWKDLHQFGLGEFVKQSAECRTNLIVTDVFIAFPQFILRRDMDSVVVHTVRDFQPVITKTAKKQKNRKMLHLTFVVEFLVCSQMVQEFFEISGESSLLDNL